MFSFNFQSLCIETDKEKLKTKSEFTRLSENGNVLLN